MSFSTEDRDSSSKSCVSEGFGCGFKGVLEVDGNDLVLEEVLVFKDF